MSINVEAEVIEGEKQEGILAQPKVDDEAKEVRIENTNTNTREELFEERERKKTVSLANGWMVTTVGWMLWGVVAGNTYNKSSDQSS